MPNSTNDPLAMLGEEPDIAALSDEFNRALTQRVERFQIEEAERVRYCVWTGQHPDGLVHQELLPEGERAMPYDRAPDTRISFADGTVRLIVGLLKTAFWRARANPRPVHVSRLTTQQVAEWRAVLSWIIHGPLKAKLTKLVEKLAQYTWTFGHAWLHPTWKISNGLKMENLQMDEILSLAAAVPDRESVLAQIPVLIADETLEENAIELFQQLFPSIGKSKARAVIRNLREDGEAEFPRPVPAENSPDLSVLVSRVHVVLPPETTEVQDARMVNVRVFLTESQVEAMANELLPDDSRWKREFCEAVKNTSGLVANGTNTAQTWRDENARLIEIVHSFVKGVDAETGVQCIYCTIWSPHLQDRARQLDGDQLYAKHYLLDYAHLEYPLIESTTEVIGESADDARGVPEVLATVQTEVKRMYDGLAIFTEMSITPPINAPLGASKLPPEFGPLAVLRRNGQQGDWTPVQLTEGAKPEIAFKLIDDKYKRRDEMFAVPNEAVHPAITQILQQGMVGSWLLTWEQCLWQLSVLVYQNFSPEELAQIIGRQPLLDVETLRRQRLTLQFDVRTLDNDWFTQLVAQIIQLLSVDTGGNIDRSKLVQALLSYMDPTLADEVTLDNQGASQAIYEKVRNDIAQIMLGNEAIYVENDPTARMKLQFAQEIVQANPNYVAQLQQNQRTAMLFEKFMANLQQSVVQEANKMVGRIGVTPMNSPGAGGGMNGNGMMGGGQPGMMAGIPGSMAANGEMAMR